MESADNVTTRTTAELYSKDNEVFRKFAVLSMALLIKMMLISLHTAFYRVYTHVRPSNPATLEKKYFAYTGNC